MPRFAPITFAMLLLVLSANLQALTLTQESQSEEKNRVPIEVKRRHSYSEEDLRKQLLLVPECGFDQGGAALMYTPLLQESSTKSAARFDPDKVANAPADYGVRFYSQMATGFKRPDWISLPWRTGLENQMGKEPAERLQVLSVNLRKHMRESASQDDPRPNPEKLRAALRTGGRLEWGKPEAIPTLVQMLQPENSPVRSLLIDLLNDIEGKEASVAIAQRAVFDLSPEVRDKAIKALGSRSPTEYKRVLVEAVRWPWQPAADHAVEALVTLKLKDAVPDLIPLLKEPDPRLPVPVEPATPKGEKSYFIREVVRVNHLSNCALCHAISPSKEDLVRGRAPVPFEAPAPLYYQETVGLFVRADITYLKQSFSLMQPVTQAGKWPGFQRFDYLVRDRKATTSEIATYNGLKKAKKLDDPYPQREALLYALRQLTGRDLGSRIDAWMPLLNPIDGKREKGE